METLFPQALFLGPMFAPVVLRLALALPYLASGYGHVVPKKGVTQLPGALPIGIAEIALGLMLLTGFLVQAAAAAVIVLTIVARIRNPQRTPWQRMLLSFGVAAALFLLGAGAFAFDKPY